MGITGALTWRFRHSLQPNCVNCIIKTAPVEIDTRGKKITTQLSEAEKFEAQGRAMANLKTAKSKVATLNTILREYADQLRETSGFVSQLIANPAYQTDSYIRLSDHLKQIIKNGVSAEEITKRIDELVDESERARQLQEQIDNF